MMTPKPYKKEQVFGYLEYFKEGAPVLIFLRGLGEKGNDLNLLYRHGPPKLIKLGKWQLISEDRFTVVAPQYFGGFFNPDHLKLFIDYCKLTYKTDTVYLTGLSAGAMSIWNYLEKYAQLKQVAAVVPICGNGNNAVKNNLEAVSQIPIWGFHGDCDTQVNCGATLNPCLKLKFYNPESRVTIYKGVNHDSWTRTYDLTGMKSVTAYDPFDISIYDWLLKYQR